MAIERGCLEASGEEVAVWLPTRVPEVIPMNQSKPYAAPMQPSRRSREPRYARGDRLELPVGGWGQAR